MIYKNFEIKKFKGIDEITIDLIDNRIISLVGLNESGKTTIMEAIYLFFKMIRGNNPSIEDLNEFRPKGIAFTGNIEIKGSLQIEESDKDRISRYWKEDLKKKSELEIPDEFNYMYKLVFDLHTYKKTEAVCNFHLKTKKAKRRLYETNKAGWISLVSFIKKEVVPEILYYDDFIFMIPNEIYFTETNQGEDDKVREKNNKTWQFVLDDILKSVDSRMNFQEHVVDLWQKDEDAANNRLAKMENVLDKKITARWGDLFPESKVNFKEIKLYPKYSNIYKRFSLSFKIRTQSKKEFLVKERSKGFKWFFSFLLFTEFRKKRTKNILFLLDEPASNLHSSAQVKILEAINDLSQESLVVYSTHSHHLINPRWLAGAYICINENLSEEILKGNLSLEEGSVISAMKYYKYVGEGLSSDKISYFQPILDKLDYKPSAIEPIPNIIILEGKNDWYTFKYFEEVILKRKEKLNFYPGAGKDKLYDIIRLYLAWGKEFIVVLDGDRGGIKAKRLYEKEFGKYIHNKIFTLQDIFNKSIATEDLIGVMDQRTIYNSVFGIGSYKIIKSKKPNKLKENLNLAINQLQFEKRQLGLNKITRENFKKLLDFLKNQIKN